MKIKYVKGRLGELETSIRTIKTFTTGNAKLKSMLASYMVVAMSGIYEDCIEHIFVERVSKAKDPEITSCVTKFIENKFRNPRYSDIKGLLNYFDETLGDLLDKKIKKRKEKSVEGLDGIVTNKNKVAHGDFSNATINDIERYHKYAKKILVELEKILRL